MTALKYEAIQLVEQMPEEQVPHIIQYIKELNSGCFHTVQCADDKTAISPKMRAFLELERMLVPVSRNLDYDKELAEARDKKYGYCD